MIWLQSNEKFDLLVEYDHYSGRYTAHSRKDLGVTSLERIEGFFSILSGIFVALYTYGQQLFLRIGDDCIQFTDDILVEVSGDEINRKMVVKKGDQRVANVEYVLDLSFRFPDDPTPFIEDEDFDFGLFVSNVAKNPNRKRVLLGFD